MYQTPSFVFGFHGCDQSVADAVLKENQALKPSEKAYDWLGHGIYFWEGNVQRAWAWAKAKKSIQKPAVVGAIIKLGNCLDLLEDQAIARVEQAYKLVSLEREQAGEALPVNSAVDKTGISFRRELDCQVIKRLQEMNNERIAEGLATRLKPRIQQHPEHLDSVRGMFPEGQELYAGAGFRRQNHIQICVINPNCIVGYFSPLKPHPDFKIL